MKLNKLLSLLAILLATTVQAQDLKILVNSKGKVGYADLNGNEVIKCQYESGQPFSNGIAIVTKSGKSGIIDATGKILLPLKYTQIIPWNCDLYLIKDGKKNGLVDFSGKVVLPVTYSHISKPNCYGKALIALGGKATTNDKKTYMLNNAKYGIIDAQGNILVEPKYKGLYEFYNHQLRYSRHTTIDTLVTDCSYLGFSNNGFMTNSAGVMDGNGKVLIKTGLYSLVGQPQSNMVTYYIVKSKKQTLGGYHDLNTGKSFQVAKIDNDVKSCALHNFTGDIAPIKVGKEPYTFIDKTGKSLRTGYTSFKYNEVTRLYAAKNEAGKWDVFNESNNDIVALSGFDDIVFPANQGDKEIYSVSKNGIYGCVNRSGDVVVPFEYENVLANSFDMIAVKKEGKWGLVSTNNTCIIPMEYARLVLPTERNAKHFWVMKSDSLYYHMNIETNKVSPTGYKVVKNFANGIAHIAPREMKVNNTQVNRAQIFSPNASKAVLDTVDVAKHTGAFGYILNTDDVLVMDLPVSLLYKDAVMKEIGKLGNRVPTEMEKKNILLEVTRENRSYDLKSTLSEDEWNY